MKKNNSRIRKILTIGIASIIIIIVAIFAIIFSLNLLYKMNNRNEETIIADNNEIVLGNQKVLYIDLTKNPNDYKKIKTEKNEIQTQQKNDVNSKNEINSKKEINIQNIDDNKLEKTNETDQNNINADNNIEKSLMIETTNIEDITKAGNVESVVKIAKDIYCLHYNNEKDAELAYNNLKDNNLIENICKNEKVTMLEYNTLEIPTEVNAQGISGNNYAWGTETTGLGRFLMKENYNKNAKDIRVAVLDSGVRTTHEVFKNEQTADRIDLTNSYNYVYKNTNIADDNGHGTMVAGIIAESTSNNVKIVPIKTLASDGNGNLSDVLEAIASVKDSVDVINLSLGLDKSKLNSKTIEIAEKVLKEAYDDNKIIICATGNDGKESVYYPACSDYTISVGATTHDNEIAKFSNYGETVDFSAPGQALILPYYTGDNLYNSSFEPGSDEYNKNSGTSFATPFVSAAATLIKSENQNYSVEEVKNILKNNSEDFGDVGKDKFFGYGAINFDINMFKKPAIISIETTKKNEETLIIEAYAVSGNNMTDWCCTLSSDEPISSDWRKIENPVKYLKMTVASIPNKDAYLWVKDEKGNITKQLVINQENYGDLNENKQIDIGDILLIQRHIAQSNSTEIANKHPEWKLSDEKLKAADINKNNTIDVGDILKLQRYIAATNSTETAKKHSEWLNLN